MRFLGEYKISMIEVSIIKPATGKIHALINAMIVAIISRNKLIFTVNTLLFRDMEPLVSFFNYNVCNSLASSGSGFVLCK